MTKTKTKYIFVIIFLFILFTFQKPNFLTIQSTVIMFLKSVMPSLFLFILFTNIILELDIKNGLKRIFKKNYTIVYIAAIGMFCGYPMGAKAISKYYDKNEITHSDAKFLMSFANNANPIYIISTIGIATLENIYLGFVLALSHYLSSLLICTYYYFHKDIIHETKTNLKSKDNISDKKLHKNIFDILTQSIKATYFTLSQILAYIIIFNVLSQDIRVILNKINIPSNAIYIIESMFEATSGIAKIALNFNASKNITLSIISFILGFSGISIIFQIYSFIYTVKIPITHIIKYKLIQGTLSFILTYTFLNISSINITERIKNIRIINSINDTTIFLIIVSLVFLFSTTIKKVTRIK